MKQKQFKFTDQFYNTTQVRIFEEGAALLMLKLAIKNNSNYSKITNYITNMKINSEPFIITTPAGKIIIERVK